MSVFTMSEAEIVDAINDEAIDDDELVEPAAWKLICQVRGRNFGSVDSEAWRSLCSTRGYLQRRANPRGY